jgi:predicted transcriptional regulator of viral defense system
MVRSAPGLYALCDYDVTSAHTLVEAVQAQAKGVVCLKSALNFHGIGTQLPHQVWLSVPYGSRITAKRSVPMQIIVMRLPGYESGIEIHELEGVTVPMYSIPKTISDCFKFRNKVGLDVALEALREALHDKRCTREEIRQFAKLNRVENIMRPYMEALSV